MNFSRSSALKCACAALLAGVVGCEPKDGVRELADGKEAFEVRDLGKAEKLFEKSLALSPDDVERLVYLARVKLELGELSAARELVSKARALSEDADVRMLAAQVAWHAKDYTTAAEGFTAIGNDTKLEPALRSQGWAGLGVVEMTCENHHLARIAFLRAIRLERRNAAAWYHLGLLYRDAFEYLEAALEQFDFFVHLEEQASPRVQKVQRNVIPALKERIARDATERPGVSKRNSAACSTALVKAEAEWKKGSYKNARQAYQEALTADPLSYPAALGLAKAWEKTDTTSAGQRKAFDYYKTACTLRPSAISTFLTAGALAARLGLNSQAVEIYSRAVAASPTSFDALDGLIRALRKTGGKAKVAQAYQLYRESIPVKKR